MPIALANRGRRFFAKVNKNGPVNPELGTHCWIWTGNVRRSYGRFEDRAAHRVAWELLRGTPLPRYLDHHYLCPKLCVNPQHLRSVSLKQNNENLTGAQRNNRAGIRGVRWHKGRWEAQVTHHGKTTYLGRYTTKEAAEAAARAERNRVFTHNDADRHAAT